MFFTIHIAQKKDGKRSIVSFSKHVFSLFVLCVSFSIDKFICSLCTAIKNWLFIFERDLTKDKRYFSHTHWQCRRSIWRHASLNIFFFFSCVNVRSHFLFSLQIKNRIIGFYVFHVLHFSAKTFSFLHTFTMEIAIILFSWLRVLQRGKY